MKILQLILRKEPFDEILSGEKKNEVRELRPNAYCSRYIVYKCDDGKTYKTADQMPEGLEGDPVVVEYDAIQFYHGYETDRRGMLVEVKDAQIFLITDDNDENIILEENGKEYYQAEIEYSLGKILNKTNC